MSAGWRWHTNFLRCQSAPVLTKAVVEAAIETLVIGET